MTSPQSVRERLWQLSWPAMISGLSVPLLGLIDTSIVGRLDHPDAVGAVALGSWLFDLSYWSFGFLRMGTTGLIAQARGQGVTDQLKAHLARPLLIGVGIGMFIVTLGQLFGGEMIDALSGDQNKEISSVARPYLFARLWGGPAVLMNYACLGWLLGMGYARFALLHQISLNLINICLSLWWAPYLGVSGVGAASATSQWLLAIISVTMIWFYLSSPRPFEQLKEDLSSRQEWLALAHLNFNLWVRTVLLLGSFGLINLMSARLGPLMLSVNALLLHLQTLQAFVLDGFAHGAEVIVGEQLGRADQAGYRSAVLRGLEFMMFSALIFSLFYFTFSPWILSLLTHHQELIEAVSPYIKWAIISPLISAPCFLLDGVMIGATQSLAMRNGMISSVIILLVSLYVLVPFLGNHGLWIAFLFFMASRALVLVPATLRLSKTMS